MLRPGKVNWKDTNLEHIGTDLDRKIKEAAAKGEPQWKGLGEREGLYVWRIEKFRVVPWPKRKYGKFHTGDSYVILNSYFDDSKGNKNDKKLYHDLHIWIGDESTQDEYGTAAYKMVECDDKLHGAAVQHREVQNMESELFLSYFGSKLTYLAGGVETGFKHVDPTVAEPHLYRVKGTQNALAITQLRVRRDQMNAGDVFILHAGEKVWQWNGKESNPNEKRKASEIARAFASKTNVIVLDQDVNDGEEEASEFWAYMPSSVSRLGVFKKQFKIQDADDKDADEKVKAFLPTLYRVPHNNVSFLRKIERAKPIAPGGGGGGPAAAQQYRLKRRNLDSHHAFLLDTGFHVYIWLGQDIHPQLRVSSLAYPNYYFKKSKRPILPVTMVKENGPTSTKIFDDFFYGAKRSDSACECIIL